MTTELVIRSTGVYTPSYSISNQELVTSFNYYVDRYNQLHASCIKQGKKKALEYSSLEFIEKVSGIKSRYAIAKESILDVNIMATRIRERRNDELSVMAEMAVLASQNALKKLDRKGKDIDVLIMASSNMQRAYPSLGIEVQHALGINGFAFDMSAACSTAVYGIKMAEALIHQQEVNSILLCNVELCTAHSNFRDRDSHFIFGDAASAILIERSDYLDQGYGQDWKILSARLHSKFSNNIRNNFGFLNNASPEGIGKLDKLFMQNGRKVFREVTPMVSDFVINYLKEQHISRDEIKRIWLHQANIHMNEFIAKKILGRPANRTEAPIVLDEYGNTSSAGAIIAFNRYSNDLNPGDIGILCAFGAGYTMGSIFLQKKT